jgi:hypothetical protein
MCGDPAPIVGAESLDQLAEAAVFVGLEDFAVLASVEALTGAHKMRRRRFGVRRFCDVG